MIVSRCGVGVSLTWCERNQFFAPVDRRSFESLAFLYGGLLSTHTTNNLPSKERYKQWRECLSETNRNRMNEMTRITNRKSPVGPTFHIQHHHQNMKTQHMNPSSQKSSSVRGLNARQINEITANIPYIRVVESNTNSVSIPTEAFQRRVCEAFDHFFWQTL